MTIEDHSDVVAQLSAERHADRTVEGALAFTLRVIARLQALYPAERVGLLIKTAGENIVPYGGTAVSASRLAYPDADLLVKVLIDIPTTNDPSWQTEDGIPNQGHHGGYLAVAPSGAGAEPPVRPPAPPAAPGEAAGGPDAAFLQAQLDLLEQQVRDLHAMQTTTNASIAHQGGRTDRLEAAVTRHERRQYRGSLTIPWINRTVTITSDPVPDPEPQP